jgi:hypothetical protein
MTLEEERIVEQQEEKQDLAVQTKRARKGDEESLSPVIRQLAISWGGALECTPHLHTEARELEAAG